MPLSGNYCLTNDIDASATANWNNGEGFIPIPGFGGVLDGQGHLIDRLNIHQVSDGSLVGLFAYVRTSGVVRSIGLTNVLVSGGAFGGGAGAVAAVNDGLIIQSYATGTVIGGHVAGGLVGNNNNYTAAVIQSYSNATVTGTTPDSGSQVGGLVGENLAGTISQSYATGPVSGQNYSWVGGLVGFNGGIITQSYAVGSVSGGVTLGGLAGGCCNQGSITQSYWDMQSTGQQTSAGGVGLTTVQLKSGLPIGFDPTVWGIEPGINSGYPYLLWSHPGSLPVALTDNNLVIEMAELAIEAYTRSTAKAVSRNWHAITAQELSIGPQVPVNYTFDNGVYSATTLSSLIPTQAIALVLQGVVQDKKSLAIVFKGTDTPGDFALWPAPDAYYATFLPLIGALSDYIRKNNIQRVLTTGHSLGGAMVQDFLGFPLAGVDPAIVSGYTWGSPGGTSLPALPSHLVKFVHTNDPILLATNPLLTTIERRLGIKFLTSGTQITINSATEFTGPDVKKDIKDPPGHKMENYLVDTKLLVRRVAGSICASQVPDNCDATNLQSGDFSTAEPVQIVPGADQSNFVTISHEDDFVLGGPGADFFNWPRQGLGEQIRDSVVTIDGGCGSDILSLPGFQFLWSWTTEGPKTNLFSLAGPGRRLVAILYNISYLHFEQQPTSKVTIATTQCP